MNFSKRDFASVVNALGYPWRSSKGQSDAEGPSPKISTQRPVDPKAADERDATEKCQGGGTRPFRSCRSGSLREDSDSFLPSPPLPQGLTKGDGPSCNGRVYLKKTSCLGELFCVEITNPPRIAERGLVSLFWRTGPGWGLAGVQAKLTQRRGLGKVELPGPFPRSLCWLPAAS